MFDGYLSLGGDELINIARTKAYLNRYLPGIDVKCADCEGLHNALADAAYTTVSASGNAAPWYRSAQPDSADFYGFLPTAITGLEDSTRTVEMTELSGDGAAPGLPRHEAKEIRVRGLMFAKTDAAMSVGLTWLRTVLDDAPCGRGLNCGGREMQFFYQCPGASTVSAANALVARYGRVMYRVEALEGPRIVSEYPSVSGKVLMIEYILSAGVPFIFTLPAAATTTTGVTPTSGPEVFCPPQTDAYSQMVIDPQITNIKRPPRPPSVWTVAMPSTWTRHTMNVATSFSNRNGVLIPTVNLFAGSADRRMIRVRFYRNGNSGSCDFEGEFLVTYAPAGSQVVIDGIRRSMSVWRSGTEYPAGNLILGSNGRPVTWPVLACDTGYHVVVDSVGSLGDARVTVDLSVRE